MQKVGTMLLAIFLLLGAFSSQAQNWTLWSPLNYSSYVSASVSFQIVNDCNNFNYSYFRTKNNTYSENGTVTFSFKYYDCSGKQQTENATMDLSKTGIDQDKGHWFLTGGGKITDIKIEELYMPNKKIWISRGANGATIDQWKLHYGDNKQSPSSTTVITPNNNSTVQTYTQPPANSTVTTTNPPPPKTGNNVHQQQVAEQINQNNARIAQNNANAQQKSENIQNATNSLTQAASDVFSAIQAEKARKEQEWLNMTPEERAQIIAMNEARQRMKDSISNAKIEDDMKLGSAHPHSIGVYVGIDARTFIADNDALYNGDANMSFYTTKALPTVGIIYESFIEQMSNALVSTGIYYIPLSTAMLTRTSGINDNIVSALKLNYLKIPCIVNYRVMKFGGYSGIYVQFGISVQYLFNATTNPIAIPKDLPANSTYPSVSGKANITKEFKPFGLGGPLGLRVNFGRNLYMQLQYDVLGGLNDQLIKDKYAGEYGTFQEKNITTAGVGITF